MTRSTLITLALLPLTACFGATAPKTSGTDTATATDTATDAGTATDTDTATATTTATDTDTDTATATTTATDTDTDTGSGGGSSQGSLGRCPAWEGELEPGTYTLIVQSFSSSSAASDTCTYSVGVSGATVAAGEDDVSSDGTAVPHVWTVEGSATVAGGTLTGTINYLETLGGAAVCDSVITLSGTPYTGMFDVASTYDGERYDITSATFAHDITATETTDNGTDACELDPGLSMIRPDSTGTGTGTGTGTSPDVATVFAVWESYTYVDTLYNETFTGTNVAATIALDDTSIGDIGYGSSVWGGSFSPDLPWFIWGEPATVARTGDTWTWSYESSVDEFAGPTSLDTCATAPSNATPSTVPNGTLQGSVDCDGDMMDTYTVTVTTAGTVSIALDTVDASTRFDPLFYLNDGDTCRMAYDDDSVMCTHW